MKEIELEKFDDYLEIIKDSYMDVLKPVVVNGELNDTVLVMMHMSIQVMMNTILSIQRSTIKLNGDYKQCLDNALAMTKQVEEEAWEVIEMRQKMHNNAALSTMLKSMNSKKIFEA
jgi:hypothetical protein